MRVATTRERGNSKHEKRSGEAKSDVVMKDHEENIGPITGGRVSAAKGATAEWGSLAEDRCV